MTLPASTVQHFFDMLLNAEGYTSCHANLYGRCESRDLRPVKFPVHQFEDNARHALGYAGLTVTAPSIHIECNQFASRRGSPEWFHRVLPKGFRVTSPVLQVGLEQLAGQWIRSFIRTIILDLPLLALDFRIDLKSHCQEFLGLLLLHRVKGFHNLFDDVRFLS